MRHGTLALAALLFAVPAFADDAPKPPSRPRQAQGLPHMRRPLPDVKAGPGGEQLKVSFKLKVKELAHEGSFVVESGSQANYVEGGEDAQDIETSGGKGVEFHKRGAVVNCHVVSDPSVKNRARAEIQIELSGPVRSPASEKVPGMETFQLQTAFAADYGRPVVLAEGPDRRVEVTIDALRP